MSFRTWLNALKSAAARPTQAFRTRPQSTGHKLYLEPLEERDVPTFLTPVNYAVGPGPQAIVSADFNNDTIPDLAVANNYDSTVSVLVGNAAVPGTFDTAVTSATGYAPLSLAVGDFNDDGNLDLATANAYDVTVLLGNGDGTFVDPPTSLGVTGNPQSVAVGDFNGDGTMDLGVTANVYTPGYYGPGYWGWYGYYPGNWYPGYDTGTVNVLLGDGAGGFSGPNTTWLDYGSHNSALAADLNGDAYEDFVTFDSYYAYVSVLLGDSSGYLQWTNTIYTGDYCYSVAAGDVNGDLNTDLVTTNYWGNSVGVSLGDGLGGFSGPNNYAVGGYPTSVVLGDFTGDGELDVAATINNSNQVAVLYGDGNGGFSTPVFAGAGSSPWDIVTGDFNGDTWLDAATINSGDGNVSVLINDHSWPTPPPPPPPSVSINDASLLEGNTGSANMTFTLTLSFGYATPITVHYETADGSAGAPSDYTATSGDVTFAPFQTSYPITIAVQGDRVWESNESFSVNLTTTDAFSGDVHGVGTIVNDEPLISIGDVTVTEGNTGSVNARFRLTLSAASDAPVTVHFATANGSATTAGNDYVATSGDATIPAGQTGIDVLVAVTGDRIFEPTENFVVNLTTPTNAGINDAQGVATILDDEPRITINNVQLKEGNGLGNGNNKTLYVFTVSLSAAYDQAVTVLFATSSVGGTATAGSDYQAQTGTLTFAPGVRTMTITIVVVADKTQENNETFFVNLSGASDNALIEDAQGMGTILDDDKRGKP